MKPPHHTFLLLFFFFFTFLTIPISTSLNSDGLALLALKSAITSDPFNALSSWSEFDSDPCNWSHILCFSNAVTHITLPNKRLSGYLPSELGALLSLRHLILSDNNFSGPIPTHLFNATRLTTLDLARNSLSGPIPTLVGSLRKLTSLDLSSNLLNGSLPSQLSELTRLVGVLNLSYNSFSGEVPASFGSFPVMVSLDLRVNNLTGKIPQVGSLLNQGPTAFAGNPLLCGFPLSTPCPEASNPNLVLEPNPKDTKNSGGVGGGAGGGGVRVWVKGISVILACGVVALVSGVLFFIYKEGKMGKNGEKMGEVAGHTRIDDVEGEGQKGKFVVVDEEGCGLGLELEDLLRASAYVVGKSKSGIVYKVVVGGGKGSGVVPPMVVAVRRLSECDDVTWRLREFESEVEAIAKVKHPNVLGLRAYYYASDEKLLVSDFIRNGSLYSLLHGDPSSELPPLSWASRLKIAQGIARGLTHIHECSPRKYIHGNFKSSKVLLDEDFHPYISGFGLTRLVSGSPKAANPMSRRPSLNQPILINSKLLAPSSIAYMAPEVQSGGGKLTQKSDVYSFGVVLMELLTGRVPDGGSHNEGVGLESVVRKVFREERPLSEIIDPALLHEVRAKKQVLAAFHIALNCTEVDVELRPRMRSVSESLDCLNFE